MEVVRTQFRKKTLCNKLCTKSCAEDEFRSIFRLPSQKFKIFAIPDVLAHGKSYEHGFMKKCNRHNLCVKSRVESSFDRFFMHRLENSKYWPFQTVEFRSVFRLPSRKFKILAIPDILAHGKSYEHGFMKKRWS
ncbi:hypothetical protein BHM03_00051148 [Ensete ventricosum]|nr:hypothetical protein BHM03_00051148 [Ensete ventricosum]